MSTPNIEILNSLQAIAKQLGSIEARLDDLDDRLKGVVKVVHIGNGRESILTRITRLEDSLTRIERSAIEKRKSKTGLIVAIVAAVGGIAAAVIQALLN